MIKQTVMTTVYGVTMYGAVLQIKRQLKALGIDDDDVRQNKTRDTKLQTTTDQTNLNMLLCRQPNSPRTWPSGRLPVSTMHSPAQCKNSRVQFSQFVFDLKRS